MASATRTQSQTQATTPGGPLRVVIVDEELPFPPVSGKRIRTLGLLERLAERHRLTYVCHRNADANEATLAVADLLRSGRVVVGRRRSYRRGH